MSLTCSFRAIVVSTVLFSLSVRSVEAQVCAPASDGVTCGPLACSPIPEDQCLAVAFELDPATGVLGVAGCDCLYFDLCHLTMESGALAPAGTCPDGTPCELAEHDTNGDGVPDVFTAHCAFTDEGSCCVDIDDGPISYDTCVASMGEACIAEGGIFHPVPDGCLVTEACCFSSAGLSMCTEMNPLCCMDSGGVPLGSGSVCDNTDPAGGCGEVCGGIAGIQCSDPLDFCLLPEGACCCDFFGVCTSRPDACPEIYDPVCGCDGVTYGNECEARAAGMSIAHHGPCERICGGLGPQPPCFDNEYCKYPLGECENSAVLGVCTPIGPGGCPRIWDPVCGCDGVTYANECEADAAGMSIDHPWECETGACCFADSAVAPSCLELSQTQCNLEGGVFLGNGSTCPSDPSVGCGVGCPGLCASNQLCFEGCGTFIQGVECILFQADTGAVYVFGDPAGYVVGDRVFVVGCIDPTCITFCMQGDGCLFGHIVEPCERTCGGIAGVPCQSTSEFCKFPEGTCGDSDLEGICTWIPGNGCPEYYDPVCGCDGVTYGNECESDAAGVSILHRGMCHVPCAPLDDGSGCKQSGCDSVIPEVQCISTALHLDIATGAITTTACDCQDFNMCHVEFGDASPFAVGYCPDGGGCRVKSEDTDGDGIDDSFTAGCVPTGACCSDIGGSPLPVPVCTDATADECAGAMFAGTGTSCEPIEACCVPWGGTGSCLNLNPLCCLAFGGVPLGPYTDCEVVDFPGCPAICGGFTSIPCDDPLTFCRFPRGTCDWADHSGVCWPIPLGCPDVWDPVCGCDGETYSNACEADAASVSIDHSGVCEFNCCDPFAAPPCIEGPFCCSDGSWVCGDGGGNWPCDGPGEVCGGVCGGFAGIPCASPLEFCKHPDGTCEMSDQFGRCIPTPSGCPDVWDPVCGCNGITYGNECEADAAHASVAHRGECNAPECVATRALLDADLTYCPDVPQRVHILLSPSNSVSAIAIEDSPPAGWVVGLVSHGGTYDAVNHKVKWGPFFVPNHPSAVHYQVTPAESTDPVALACFEGTVSVDGINEPVCGEQCLEHHCRLSMAADQPQPACDACGAGDCMTCSEEPCENGDVTLCELIGYACRWQNGCNDDLAGTTRAAFVWRNGECYCYDQAAGNWFPSLCPAPGSGYCTDVAGGPLAVSEIGSARFGTFRESTPRVREGRDGVISIGRIIQVPITLEPPVSATAAGLEVSIPAGWKVMQASDNGEWDSVNRKVKWGPWFGDLSRTVTLTLRTGTSSKAPARLSRITAVTPVARLRGTVSYDGLNYPIVTE